LGKIKELSLPVSSKHGDMEYFSNTNRNFVYWYQFPGTLNDATAPGNTSKQLVSSKKPRWSTFAKSYGLVIGPDDVYTLPGAPFELTDTEEGQGEILFHFVPVKVGTILKTSFDLYRSSTSRENGLNAASAHALGNVPEPVRSGSETFDKLILTVYADQTSLSLRLSAGTETYEAKLDFPVDSDSSGFVMGSLTFQYAQDHFSAWLSRKNPPMDTKILTLALDHPLNGKGIVQIGETAFPQRGNTGETQTAILNEFAVSLTKKAVNGNKPETIAIPPAADSPPETVTGADGWAAQVEAQEDQQETEKTPGSPLAESSPLETEAAALVL
jgi:hypothetical protein